jgi:hypothetical protein
LQVEPEKYHINILDGGADTCVLGQGWEILSANYRRNQFTQAILFDAM